jgi:hypothetical protein
MPGIKDFPLVNVPEKGIISFAESVQTGFELRHGRLQEIQSYVRRNGVAFQTKLTLKGINPDDELVWELVI